MGSEFYTKYLQIGERLVCQLEIHSLDDKSSRRWLHRYQLKEIESLLHDPIKARVEEKEKYDKSQNILTGRTIRLGFVFKKKSEHHTLLLSDHDSDTDDFFSTAYTVFREKIVVFMSSLESHSPKSVTKLVQVLHDCSQSQSSSISISNYFTKKPSSSHGNNTNHAKKTSDCNTENNSVLKVPSSEGKRTVIKNLVGRTNKAISKVKKEKRIAKVLQNMKEMGKTREVTTDKALSIESSQKDTQEICKNKNNDKSWSVVPSQIEDTQEKNASAPESSQNKLQGIITTGIAGSSLKCPQDKTGDICSDKSTDSCQTISQGKTGDITTDFTEGSQTQNKTRDITSTYSTESKQTVTLDKTGNITADTESGQSGICVAYRGTRYSNGKLSPSSQSATCKNNDCQKGNNETFDNQCSKTNLISCLNIVSTSNLESCIEDCRTDSVSERFDTKSHTTKSKNSWMRDCGTEVYNKSENNCEGLNKFHTSSTECLHGLERDFYKEKGRDQDNLGDQSSHFQPQNNMSNVKSDDEDPGNTCHKDTHVNNEDQGHHIYMDDQVILTDFDSFCDNTEDDKPEDQESNEDFAVRQCTPVDSDDSDLPDCSFVKFKLKRRSSIFQRALDICESLNRDKNRHSDSVSNGSTISPKKRKRNKYILPSLSPTNSDDELHQTKYPKYEDKFDDNMNEVSDEELECFILSEDNTDSNIEAKIRNIGNVSFLNEEQLRYLVLKNKKYLMTIFKGDTESQRHLDYKKGGRSRKLLNHQVHVGLFTEVQQDIVMETLMSIFCKKHHKYLEYVMKVLLPEMLIKIHMDVYNVCHTESEALMREALSIPDGVFQ